MSFCSFGNTLGGTSVKARQNRVGTFLTIVTTGSPVYTVNGTLGDVNSYYTVTSANASNTISFNFDNPTSNVILRLLVLGAGGGGVSGGGTGGGAGAFLDISFNLKTTTSQTITVNNISQSVTDSNGSNSTFNMSGGIDAITGNYSIQGGLKGIEYGNFTSVATNGASNGGSGRQASTTNPQTTPTSTTVTINNSGLRTLQGFRGGNPGVDYSNYYSGGGGAGGPGGSSGSSWDGGGGAGRSSDITGTSVTYGVGGNGGKLTNGNANNGIFIIRILQK